MVDFGWRALKETTDISKALIAEQKGLKPKRSYFFGCSDGGREALMEAQRYPMTSTASRPARLRTTWSCKTTFTMGGTW